MKLPIDNVLSNLEATFPALKIPGNESWKNQFSVKVGCFYKSSETIPPVSSGLKWLEVVDGNAAFGT